MLKEIGQQIKLLCSQKGITTMALADKTGIQRSTMSRIVNGVSKNPKLLTLYSIAESLEVPIRDLFPDNNIRGYIEINGDVKTIKTVKDLHNLSGSLK